MPDQRGKENIWALLRKLGLQVANDVEWVVETSSRRLERFADQLRRSSRTLNDVDADNAAKVAKVLEEGSTQGLQDISGLIPSPFAAHVLYHGARLRQCKEVFPKAFPDAGAPGMGHIRTASHGHTGSVYLAELTDIADVYGASSGFPGDILGSRRFHPAGMRLGINVGSIAVQRITPETCTAMTFVRGTSDRVGITSGPLSAENIASVRFHVYGKILETPDVHLDVDGFPALERLSQAELRVPSLVLAHVSDIADAVRQNYPNIEVSVGMSPLSVGEVTDLVKMTGVVGATFGFAEIAGTLAEGSRSGRS